MAYYPTYLRRIGYYWTCIAPASILSEDSLVEEDTGERLPSLREAASRDGVCFLEVLHKIQGTDLYVAHVDADPEQLNEQRFRIICTEEQLAYALPWDCRLQGKSSVQILSILDAHAQEVLQLLGLRHTDAPSYQPHPEGVLPLTLCEEVVVTVGTSVLKESIRASEGERPLELLRGKRISIRHMQQALLHIVLSALSLRILLINAEDRTPNEVLKHCHRKVLAIQRWQRQSHQRVVNIFPEMSAQDGGVVWRLLVGCPDVTLLQVA